MTNVQKILPSSFTEISVERLLHSYSRTPKVIYISVLILVLIGFASLFAIETEVSVRAQGMLKVPGERIYLKASSSGYVHYINPLLRENMQITMGDTLIIMGNPVWEEQLQHASKRAEELKGLLADVAVLTNLGNKGVEGEYDPNTTFETALYKQNYQLFCHRHQNSLLLFSEVKKNYERDKRLYSQQVIAPIEFEQTLHEYHKSMANLSTLYLEQVNQWRVEQQKYHDEQLEIQSKIAQLTLQKQGLTIIAPVSGSVQQLVGIPIGHYCTEGEIMMEISADGALYAECYVTPRDIGLIRTGQLARLQIDAYNYTEWGVLSAYIVDIANDVVLPEGSGQPFYKVLCKTQKEQMSLKNGYTSSLKKGMTFQARFQVAKRTLFQWLYDKADHWLNPNNSAQK